jgi:peptidoglycan/LPS O-acetylase OafA/YrhL
MVRGMAGLSVGVLLGWYMENRPGHSVVLDAASLVAFPLSVFLMFLDNVNGFLFVVLFSIVIVQAFDPRSFFSRIFRNELWNRLGGISLHIFIVHTLVKRTYFVLNPHLHLSGALYLACYLVTVLVVAFAYKFVCDRIRGSRPFKKLLS